MPLQKDRHCSYCGTAYPEPLVWPRNCLSCQSITWANPIPVAVVLIPIQSPQGQGLLVVRRGIEPRKGWLSLIGGFVEENESWQAGGAREVREEVGLTLDAAQLKPFWFCSTEPRPNRILLFAVAPPLALDALSPFVPNEESTERGVIYGPDALDEIFAFSLHLEAARRWFAEQGITGPHRFHAA